MLCAEIRELRWGLRTRPWRASALQAQGWAEQERHFVPAALEERWDDCILE
jgi:hypothetical protein